MKSLAVAAPLRRKDFALFWAGQWVSRVGDYVFLAAQNWLVWSLTGSGAAMATVTLCQQVPAIGMLLVGGALVDRLPRRWVSVLSDLIRGAILLGLFAIHRAGALQVWHLYGLAAAFGLVSAFSQPAFQALVQTLVPPEERVAGLSLVQAGHSIAGIAGPALGGLIVGLGGFGLAFLLDGLTFLGAAAALLAARPSEPARVSARAPLRIGMLVADLVEALRLVRGRPFLLVGIGAMALIVITGQAPVVLLRPWVAEKVGGGVQTLSLALSFFSMGMFLTVTFLGAVRVRRRGLLIYGGMVAAGLLQMGMAFARAPWHMWALDLLTGAAVMIYGVLWEALLQDQVPPDAMGRVSAIDRFGTEVLYPAGVAAVGVLSTLRGGPFWLLAGGGALTVLVAAGALLTPQIRQTD